MSSDDKAIVGFVVIVVAAVVGIVGPHVVINYHKQQTLQKALEHGYTVEEIKGVME